MPAGRIYIHIAPFICGCPCPPIGVPFGGYKDSGIGREKSQYALRAYTQVSVDPEAAESTACLWGRLFQHGKNRYADGKLLCCIRRMTIVPHQKPCNSTCHCNTPSDLS